jgi:DNA (cytosine-5)-methyltransferase 1
MRVCELFAGVGGFRLGLERSGWDIAWSNQWEPGERKQWASKCYVSHFGADGHVNRDIASVRVSEVPNHDLLVAGFPCQDYSVATTKAKGIQGKKGVLWWEIYRILKARRPPFVVLENVDRLLRSPSGQRGRDFGVMLWCLSKIGYGVEWRLVNAADYGAPQRRRRLFILAARGETAIGRELASAGDWHDWLQKTGFFATVFPAVHDLVYPLVPEPPHQTLHAQLQRVSDRFSFDFQSAGVMAGGTIWTAGVKPRPEPLMSLGSILETDVEDGFFVRREDIATWRYLKGSKAEPRKASNGYRYAYSEGAIPFPDRLDQPSRTILTKEGSPSPSRFKHVVLDPQVGRYRVLTPLECERLNLFPDGWTEGLPPSRRYFCMGNALVVGLVERIGAHLMKWASHDLSAKIRRSKRQRFTTRRRVTAGKQSSLAAVR